MRAAIRRDLPIGLCLVAAWCFLAGETCIRRDDLLRSEPCTQTPRHGICVALLPSGRRHVSKTRAPDTRTHDCSRLPAILWVSHISPHWMQELSGNLSATSVPGGITDPGPNSMSGSGGGMIIDLQTVVSVFRNDPRLYNPITYLICGLLLVIWISDHLEVSVRRRRNTILRLLPSRHYPCCRFIIAHTMQSCCS